MTQKKVRVRFAPSPTGPLHMGGVRTALFNYLFAKKHNGDFILRIEDTDQTRFVKGAEEYIIESLAWCGINFDEGIKEGGNYGPYRQSERKGLYHDFSEKLIQSGHAYYAFDTPEELNKLRKDAEDNKETFTYNSKTRVSLNNSLALSETKVNEKLEDKTPFVIRFKIPENDTLFLQDIIRGEIKIDTNALDDKILFKSDGMPTYHLANIVDDHLMKISHVIRGEEWLPSLPLHILLYKALNWEAPEFAHLPLILKPVGNGKLSKRDGDKLGFPVFPIQWNSPTGEVFSGYRETGYFPEAFINLLALLGWNPGTEQELFSLDELINTFSFEHVGKSGSKFDPEKAKWFNHQYLNQKSNSEITELFEIELKEKGINKSHDFNIQVVGLVKERVQFVSEIWDNTSFFYEPPKDFNPKAVKKRWKEQTPEIITNIATVLENVSDFTREQCHDNVIKFIEDNEIGMGAALNALRICMVGTTSGPDLFTIIELLGKEEVIGRIDYALQNIRK